MEEKPEHETELERRKREYVRWNPAKISGIRTLRVGFNGKRGPVAKVKLRNRIKRSCG